jgi:hypothetical protein
MLQRKNSVAAPRPRPRVAIGRRVTVMVMLAGLVACGQKGPLVLNHPVPGTGAASAPR